MTVASEDPKLNTGSVRNAPQLADETAVRSLLARANLLRMRRQWDEAIAACTEALRHDPSSASAHSLLGDIYEAQGKGGDAIQWYAMALEIDPANAVDRAKLERLTESQRVRLRTQDLEAAAVAPRPGKRERTLEWFDRIFPPGRNDSVPRLILAMSISFAAIIAVCTGFIYFFIVPRHEASVAEDSTPSPMGRNIGIPSLSEPVLMTPAVAVHADKVGTPVPSEAADARHTEATIELPAHLESVASVSRAHKTAGVVAVATTSDPATLRTRLTPLLNNGEMQVAGVTAGPSGALYLDLVLPVEGASENTERLRERALRAASIGAHAIAGLVSPEMDHVFVRIAVASHGTTTVAHTTHALAMVFAAEVPLRYFRDADVATLTPSDLAGRFQSAQWYSSTPDTQRVGSAEMAANSSPAASPSSGVAPASTSTAAPTVPAQ